MRRMQVSDASCTRKCMPTVLAICWIAGLICGIVYYRYMALSMDLLMYKVFAASASLTGLLCATIVPFLITVSAVKWFSPVILAAVWFIKAFLYAFVSFGILSTCGSGGWLVRFLLTFNDSLMLPLLYWYWLHMVHKNTGRICAASGVVLFVLSSVTILDYHVVAPLACLLESMKG